MTDLMRDVGAPKIVDRNNFQTELDALRVREKAHTREGDAIAAARRRLPMVEVDGAAPLIGSLTRVAYWCSRPMSRRGGPTRSSLQLLQQLCL
jgi:hypothetical protein